MKKQSDIMASQSPHL
jgi:hypothetical protein